MISPSISLEYWNKLALSLFRLAYSVYSTCSTVMFHFINSNNYVLSFNLIHTCTYACVVINMFLSFVSVWKSERNFLDVSVSFFILTPSQVGKNENSQSHPLLKNQGLPFKEQKHNTTVSTRRFLGIEDPYI